MTIQKGDLCRINCPDSLYHGSVVEIVENPAIADKGVFVGNEFLQTVKCLIVFGPDFPHHTYMIIRLGHLEALDDGI